MRFSKQNGVLICVEGIDGSGKTTQARRLVRTLVKKGYGAVYTAEPSNGVFGKIIRKHLLHGDGRVPTIVEAVLFAVDRIDHTQNKVEPLLEAGKIVVCDRYVYSSISYQGASNLDLEWIKKINKNAIKPELAIYVDVPPAIVIRRIKRRKSIMETLQIQKKVRSIYLKLVKERQLIMVDGNASIGEVAKTIENVVLKFLGKHNG